MAATQVPDAKLYEASQSLGSELGNAPLTELGELTFATLRGAANSAIEDATANGLPGLARDFGIQQFFAAQPGGGGTNVATGTFGEITASAAPAGLGVASPSQSGILSLSPSLQSLGAAGAGTSASPGQTNAAATPAIGSPNVLTSEETALAEGETAPADPTSNGEPSLPDVGVQPPDETVAASPGGVGAETSGGGVTGLPTGTEPSSGADTPVTGTNPNVNPDTGIEAVTDTGPVTSVDTVTGTGTGTGTGPSTGADTDPETDTGTDTGSGTDPDTGAGPVPDADSEPGIDSGGDIGAGAGGNVEAGSGMDTVPDTGVDTGTGTGPSSGGDADPGTDNGTVPQLGTETGIGPETETGTGTGTGSDTGSDTGAGPGPETGSEPAIDGGDDSGTGAGGNAQAGTGSDTGSDEGSGTNVTTGTGSGAGTDTGSNPGSGSTAEPLEPADAQDIGIDLTTDSDTLAGVDVGLDPVESLLGTDIDLPITADLDLTAPAAPGADEDLTLDLALTEPLTGDTLAGVDVGLDPVESLLGTDIDPPITADLDLTGTAAPAAPGADEDLTIDLALTEPLTGDTLAGVDVGLDPVEALLGTDIDLPITADLDLTGAPAPAAPAGDEDLTIDLALTEPLTGDTLAGVDVGLDPVESLLGTDIDLPITADLDLTGAAAPAAPGADEDLTIDLALTEPLTGDTLAGVDVGLDPVETLLGTDIDLPITAEIDATNLFTELGSITPSSTTVEELASPTVEATSDALVAAGSLLTDSIANATENLISADTLFNADFGTSSEAVAGTDTQAANEINFLGFDLLETTSSVATDLTGAVSGSGLSAGIESTVAATTSSLTGTLKSLFG